MVEHRHHVAGRSHEPAVVEPGGGVTGAVAPQIDAHHAVVGGQRPGQRVEHAGAEAVGVEHDQRRTVTAPVKGPDGEAVVLDRPPRAAVAPQARPFPSPGARLLPGRAEPEHTLRLADHSRALGILPGMPTAAGSRLRCEQCETEIIVVKGTDGEVSCCGQPMAAREG